MTDTTGPPTPTPLGERPSFLLAQLGLHAATRFAERLAPLGLHPRHFVLLAHLAGGDGQTQQQLADTMGIHRNVMVGLVDDLEDRGLVQRRRHPADRRAHALHLTEAARDLLAQAQHAADSLSACTPTWDNDPVTSLRMPPGLRRCDGGERRRDPGSARTQESHASGRCGLRPGGVRGSVVSGTAAACPWPGC